MTSCYSRFTAGSAASHSLLQSPKLLPPPPATALVSCYLRDHHANQRLPTKLLVRSSKRNNNNNNIYVLAAAAAAERSDGDEATVGDLVDKRKSGERTVEINVTGKSNDRRVEVVIAAAVTVVLGVGNRVLYKLALVPLRHYPFFLAQLATFGYLIFILFFWLISIDFSFSVFKKKIICVSGM